MNSKCKFRSQSSETTPFFTDDQVHLKHTSLYNTGVHPKGREMDNPSVPSCKVAREFDHIHNVTLSLRTNGPHEPNPNVDYIVMWTALNMPVLQTNSAKIPSGLHLIE